MWARRRFDIRWSDLGFGVLRSFLPPQRSAQQERVEQAWSESDDALACLSVRSGFDLLLAALELPPKSEMLVSAVTIPDMVGIIEEHDLVPVPVDLVIDRMAPSVESLRRAITPATRAILVAHLFGSRIPLDAILRLAKEHGLLVIEDCAQAFAGEPYRGDMDADASMFSFGPIKSTTALGGALLRVRDRDLLERMRAQQAGYPVQSRWAYLRRLLKYTVFKAISSRPLASAVVFVSWAVRYEYDRLVNWAARSFAGPGFFLRIRRRPSAPLLAVMAKRLSAFDSHRLADQVSKGKLLVELLDGNLRCPGGSVEPHTYWAVPVLVDDPGRAITTLRREGFDATQGQSLCVVQPPRDRRDLVATAAEETLPRLVYLPFYPEMPTPVLRRMAEVLLGECGRPEPTGPRPENPLCRC